MKLKEFLIVLGIALVLVVIIVVANNKNNNEESNLNNEQTQVSQEENVEVKLDGTKVNTSKKLSQTKTVEGLEISNIELTENNNVSKILAEVKNPTTNALGDFAVNITVVDKAGNEITTIVGYIDRVEPGKTAQLNASATEDFANAYDLKITKK